MRAWWRSSPVEDRLLWSLGAVALLLGSFIVGHWWGRDDVIFGALQTVFSLAAFIAAAAAVKATWPQYRAWRASPDVRLWIEMADTESDVPHRVVGGTAEFAEAFIVLVVIQNTGEGAMRAALINVLAPANCDLRPLDTDKTHYLSPLLHGASTCSMRTGTPHRCASPSRETTSRQGITCSTS